MINFPGTFKQINQQYASLNPNLFKLCTFRTDKQFRLRCHFCNTSAWLAWHKYYILIIKYVFSQSWHLCWLGPSWFMPILHVSKRSRLYIHPFIHDNTRLSVTSLYPSVLFYECRAISTDISRWKNGSSKNGCPLFLFVFFWQNWLFGSN